MDKKFVVCITGASGIQYGIKLIEELLKVGFVYTVVSNNGFLVMEKELNINKKEFLNRFKDFKNFKLVNQNAISSKLASGSQLTTFDGVIIAPCSMSTLGAVANGINNNLIHRIAEVSLKERIKLILLVREMPYSLIHIENMRKITLSGGIIAPATPAFYHNPKSVDDIINFVVGKILDILGLKHNLYKRWNS